MPAFLSQPWLDELKRLAAGQPERPGATAVVEYVVKGAPTGDVIYHWVVDDGKLVDARLGPVAGDAKDLTLTMTWADAQLIQRGELDEQAAYMQGKVKAEGDMAKLLALLPITGSPEYKELQEQLRSVTEY